MKTLKVVCSYCKKEMPEKEPFSENNISHTICDECYTYFKEQWSGLSLEKYLDKFNTPILIVDKNSRIVAANAMAEKFTGKVQREVIGLLGGDALECVYARLPEGCGKTVHCETCTIRRSVTEVVKNGKPQMHLPVEITQEDKSLNLFISTEKIGDLICITIEN